jgi:hypothetical protein
VNRRQVLWLVVIAGVAFWLWKSGKISKDNSRSAAPASAAGSVGTVPGSAGFECLTAAEAASRETHEAAMVLLRTPIDPAAFSAASDRASSSISSAEGKCRGGGSSSEQKSMEESRGALTEMRALLSDLSGTLSGGGSASEVPRRREAVDVRLAAARAALQS